MTRRELIALLGSAAATWPLVVRAQQPASMPLVAMLIGADTVETDGTLAAFLDGLQQLGWTKGRNVRIELRRGEGDAERIRKHAAELAHLAPNVILASGTVTMGPLLQATQALPIVFVNVTDPVGAGFVQSLSRPGGNTTGFIQFDYSLSGKWVELLKEIAPRVTRAAVLRDAAITSGIGQFAVIQAVARSIGIEVSPTSGGRILT
jgi:putative tryptophan/tyrosine transport system substrate-binding protein